MAKPSFSLRRRDRSGASSVVIIVLIASTVVAAVLATQAVIAGRQRRAISEGMLRQYAQLAAWEFTRQARRDVEQALLQSLRGYAHPEHARRVDDDECGCGGLERIEHWFEVTPAGELKTDAEPVRAALGDPVARASLPAPAAMEGPPRILPAAHDAGRLIALRREPHGKYGGHVGLLTTVQSLGPVFTRTYQRASLLPAVLAGKRDARTLVDLRVTDAHGQAVFASPHTTPGPYVIQAALWSDESLPVTVAVSMTPSFIATLGPEHAAGLSTTFVIALVAVNGLLVVVGVWQFGRERELARLRSDFVASVSHELRTPLAQIRMFSETLLLDRVRNADERRRALEIIGHESTRLGQLVDNVLRFYRRPRQPASDARERIDFKAFAGDVVESFKPLAASRRAELTFAFSAADAMVRGDAGGLRQVLLNLLDNAVKFGPAGQTIAVHVAAAGDSVVLTVVDGGPGVPLAERKRIFDAFERGRRTNGTGGAGIGLAVVQQIVIAHGGDVRVDDAPGGGARFMVTLPLVTERHGSPDVRGHRG